ncbi:hypothetical protein AJ80_05479 [Polytolypa hystricis UAMH7299]|uniref:Arabinosidase n=1 Tax=Polytolypa hystricis (strain UAMH7299) TaxID=1447883 RepID=A0A2B7XV16_POLH7|nr:hypothetical protein AJ80_05479 [Polytolypa hystricis UAMH7299]
MKALSIAFTLLVAFNSFTIASPVRTVDKRQNSQLVGYLGAFFLGNEPYVYFDLSNGNNALSFSPLNRGGPILIPTSGTGGIRDPSLISGGGGESGRKWYIIGTDLHIGKTDWDTAQRHGSLSIFVWESTDLVNWSQERLVKVENDNAGMVWAPDAIWDEEAGQYMVHWSSRFFAGNDPNHAGTRSASMIRYAYTSDFRTFSEPKTYIDPSPLSVIDLAFIHMGGNSYARFLKNEASNPSVYMERSDNGLFGTWTRPGGPNAYIREGVEGPYAYRDNLDPNKTYLLVDYYGADGYRPLQSTNLNSQNSWVDADRSSFPQLRRHGSVISITQDRYDALQAKWR